MNVDLEKFLSSIWGALSRVPLYLKKSLVWRPRIFNNTKGRRKCEMCLENQMVFSSTPLEDKSRSQKWNSRNIYIYNRNWHWKHLTLEQCSGKRSVRKRRHVKQRKKSFKQRQRQRQKDTTTKPKVFLQTKQNLSKRFLQCLWRKAPTLSTKRAINEITLSKYLWSVLNVAHHLSAIMSLVLVSFAKLASLKRRNLRVSWFHRKQRQVSGNIYPWLSHKHFL